MGREIVIPFPQERRMEQWSRCRRDGPPQRSCWGCYPCASQGLPHQCQQRTCTSCQPRAGRHTAGQVSKAVEFPCGAGGPPSRPRQLFVVEMGPKASESDSSTQLKVCCHPASPPVLALVPVWLCGGPAGKLLQPKANPLFGRITFKSHKPDPKQRV